MESPILPPASSAPGTPLHTMSPERVNRQALPQSPSLPLRMRDDPFFPSQGRSSDVAEKVLQFNNMNKDTPQKHRNNEAALHRAVLGREEAEGETRRLREENKALQKQLEIGKARELKVAQRLESVMEEMQRLKISDNHKQTVYEKEVRRARKEAFKSSSSLLRAQEELKTARNRFVLMREEVEVQKRKVEVRESEVLKGQFDFINLQEEIDRLKQKLMQVEEERNALRTNLKEEEVARIAAEGRIPLPPSTPDTEFASPKKARQQPLGLLQETAKDIVSDHMVYAEELDLIKKELEIEKQFHKRTNELVDAMKLECQLKICSCRRAERLNQSYIFMDDILLIEEQDESKHAVASIEDKMGSLDLQAEAMERNTSLVEHEAHVDREPTKEKREPKEIIEFSPKSGTFRRVSLLAREASQSPTPQLSPPVPIRSVAPPTGLAPPLAPTDLSESPSLLSLGNESRPSDERPRSSDECVVFSETAPSPPQVPHPSSSRASSPNTPRNIPAQLLTTEFPPTPGADLTLTAPINFSVPAAIVQQLSCPTPDPADISMTEPVKASAPRPAADTAVTEPINLPITPAAHAHPVRPVCEVPMTEPRYSASQMDGSTRLIETHTTTTIPLAGESTGSRKFPYSPGASKTREEALESIQRWRAGRQRARSVMGHVGGTPRKIGTDPKRDITR